MNMDIDLDILEQEVFPDRPVTVEEFDDLISRLDNNNEPVEHNISVSNVSFDDSFRLVREGYCDSNSAYWLCCANNAIGPHKCLGISDNPHRGYAGGKESNDSSGVIYDAF